MSAGRDFSALVGSEVGLSGWHTIDQARIDAYADIVADRQFIHTDPEAAASSPFGGTIAHGFLTVGLLSVMSYEALSDFDGYDVSVNYGFDRLRFVSPVPSGARVRGRFRLGAVEEKSPGAFTFHWDVTVEIEGAEKPALVARWITQRHWRPD